MQDRNGISSSTCRPGCVDVCEVFFKCNNLHLMYDNVSEMKMICFHMIMSQARVRSGFVGMVGWYVYFQQKEVLKFQLCGCNHCLS